MGVPFDYKMDIRDVPQNCYGSQDNKSCLQDVKGQDDKSSCRISLGSRVMLFDVHCEGNRAVQS